MHALAMTKRVQLAGALGTLIEWAEFSFYGYLAYHMAHLFFPKGMHHALLLTFALFALSYIARPLGALYFGALGDRLGRRPALALSMTGMGLATLGIGLLPTYHTIGWLAPVLLILCRLTQGISMSGEFTGAAVFMSEHAINEQPNLTVSWLSVASALGMLLGSMLAGLVTLSFMPSWGWRIPFLLGAVGCMVARLCRMRLSETPVFQALANTQTPKAKPLGLLINHYAYALVQCFSIAAFVGVYVYTCNLWWTSYVIEAGFFSHQQAHWLATFGVFSVVVLTPMAALGADYYGSRTSLIAGLGLAMGVIPCMFWLSQTAHVAMGILAQSLYALANALVTGAMFRYLTQILPPEARFTGLSVSWSLAVALLGGTAPMVAQYLSGAGHQATGPVCYGLAVTALALIVMLRPNTTLQWRSVSKHFRRENVTHYG